MAFAKLPQISCVHVLSREITQFSENCSLATLPITAWLPRETLHRVTINTELLKAKDTVSILSYLPIHGAPHMNSPCRLCFNQATATPTHPH